MAAENMSDFLSAISMAEHAGCCRFQQRANQQRTRSNLRLEG